MNLRLLVHKNLEALASVRLTPAVLKLKNGMQQTEQNRHLHQPFLNIATDL